MDTAIQLGCLMDIFWFSTRTCSKMRSAQFGIYQIPTVMNQAVYLTLRGINVTDILIQHHQQVIIKAKFIFIFL